MSTDESQPVSPTSVVSEFTPHMPLAKGRPHPSLQHQAEATEQDSALISLGSEAQAHNLLYSAVMNQTSQLMDCTPKIDRHSYNQQLLTNNSWRIYKGISGLFDEYKMAHPIANTEKQRQEFLVLSKTGLDNGYNETCEVLAQLNALHPHILSSLQYTRSEVISLLEQLNMASSQ